VGSQQPNSEPIEPQSGSREDFNEDPLAGIFGPGNAQLVGEENDEIPEQVLELMEAQGLGTKKDFYTVVKSVPEGASETDFSHAPYIKGFKRAVPSIEWLALNYGPGKYLIQFRWRGKTETKKNGNVYENVFVEVSDKFESDYREYQYKKKAEAIRKRKEDMKNARMESELERGMLGDETEKVDPVEAGKRYVKDIISASRELGLARSGGSGIEWSKILPAVLTALPAILDTMQKRSNAQAQQMQQLMMLLLNQSSSSNKELMEVFKTKMGGNDSNKAVEDFRNMIFGALDIKGALMNHGKESISDKIFNMIQQVAPQILHLAMMSKQSQQNNPAYHAAKGFIDNSPDFQQMAEDPNILRQVIVRCDEAFGWEQTDMILAVSGFERPDNMPRDPEKKKPYEARTGTSSKERQCWAGQEQEETETETEAVQNYSE